MPFAVASTPNPTKRKLIAVGMGTDPFGPYEDLHVEFRHDAANDNPEVRGLTEAFQQCNAAYRLLKEGFLTATFDQAAVQGKDGLARSAFVTLGVPASEAKNWPQILQAANVILSESIGSNKSLFAPAFQCPEGLPERHARIESWAASEGFDDNAITQFVKPILKTVKEIAPFVRGDGGSIKYVSYDLTHDKVYVDLTGACVGCPSTKLTFQRMSNRVYELSNLNVVFEPIGPNTPKAAHSRFILD